MRPRSARLMLAAIAAIALSPGIAQAQLDSRTVVTVLRECRKLEDTTARIACYDNIPLGEVARPASSVPAARPPAPQDFGASQLPPSPQPRAAPEHDAITAKVVAAVERTPGIYLLTLEDGAQWQFVDSAPPAYDPPRRGSMVEIMKTSLGSYLLRYAGQAALRARRVR